MKPERKLNYTDFYAIKCYVEISNENSSPNENEDTEHKRAVLAEALVVTSPLLEVGDFLGYRLPPKMVSKMAIRRDPQMPNLGITDHSDTATLWKTSNKDKFIAGLCLKAR
jgi:hypothetical protein